VGCETWHLLLGLKSLKTISDFRVILFSNYGCLNILQHTDHIWEKNSKNSGIFAYLVRVCVCVCVCTEFHN